MNQNSVLLISVGGSAAPLLKSIEQHQPAKIIFFVSGNTRDVVNKQIIPALCAKRQCCPDHETVLAVDPESLGECVIALLSKVPEAMEKLGFATGSWPRKIDFTGGTKVMSAAMVWAASKYSGDFSYVGGKARTKDGVGTVEDGNELFLNQENPWDKVAYFELESAMQLFNHCQYRAAADTLAGVESKIDSPATKEVFACLKTICDGFHAWDVFAHGEAQRLLEKSTELFVKISKAPCVFVPTLNAFATRARSCVENHLRKLKIKSGYAVLNIELIVDLLANAERRAEIEHKYEDACARCYSVIEKYAKFLLDSEYGIDNSAVVAEQLPEPLRNEFTRKYFSRQENLLQFGLNASFRLLNALGHPAAERFFARENMEHHLEERNQSILAHGVKTLNRGHFDALFSDCCALLEIDESELPDFPQFQLKC